MLNNKTIILGVTGSIAAYKAADLASKLTQAGARVEVVMTGSAARFIKPLTFRSVTGKPAIADVFKSVAENGVGHIELATAADLVIIAPASAATIAKLAAGICDDMLTLIVMATKAPVILAPRPPRRTWPGSKPGALSSLTLSTAVWLRGQRVRGGWPN
jgi:phosphopantothenoylcysteine decarboxylase/phosphopantothenate--cysteine ligase